MNDGEAAGLEGSVAVMDNGAQRASIPSPHKRLLLPLYFTIRL